jgi:coatomer subunit beta'
MLNDLTYSSHAVHAAKFITREKWLIAGDENGCIHVYNYGKQEGVESFDAHDSNITTLDVHRTHPFVLSSSSDDDHMIKLWDWNKGWECTKKFQGHTDRVTQLKFNPKDASSFASASIDGTVKVNFLYIFLFIYVSSFKFIDLLFSYALIIGINW